MSDDAKQSGWKTVSVRLSPEDLERARKAASRAGMRTETRGTGIWLRKAIMDALDREEQEAATT